MGQAYVKTIHFMFIAKNDEQAKEQGKLINLKAIHESAVHENEQAQIVAMSDDPVKTRDQWEKEENWIRWFIGARARYQSKMQDGIR